MHRIIIKNLRLRCIIGINPEEMKEKQDIIINAVIWTDFSKASRSDSLEDAVNYWDLNRKIIHLVEESKFNLAETLASRIADSCLEDKRINKVRIRIDKPKALKSAESIAVELTKER